MEYFKTIITQLMFFSSAKLSKITFIRKFNPVIFKKIHNKCILYAFLILFEDNNLNM